MHAPRFLFDRSGGTLVVDSARSIAAEPMPNGANRTMYPPRPDRTPVNVSARRRCAPCLLAPFLACALFVPTGVVAERLVFCGDTVDGSGMLAGSCAGEIVVRGGKLDLGGHTLSGSVRCDAQLCEIVSDPPNGTIRGAAEAGSYGIVSAGGALDSAGSVIVDSVIVAGFATGIAAANVQLTRSLVAGNLGHGVEAAGTIEAADSIVSLNGGDGLHSRLGGVSVTDCRLTENLGSGVRALAGVIAVRSRVADNGADGIENYSAGALVFESEVVANGRHGVRSDDSDCDPADRLELVATRSAGNGRMVECGETLVCADLVSCAPPVLGSGASCGSSHRMLAGVGGETWRTCDFD